MFCRRNRLKNYIRREIMSQLTDQMTVAVENLKAQLAGSVPTSEQIAAQIHAIIDPQVAGLQSTIDAITAGEKDDATKIADINAALTEFTSTFAPATPAPAPAPAPAPEPQPDSPPAAQ
jgi:hypothetical protein